MSGGDGVHDGGGDLSRVTRDEVAMAAETLENLVYLIEMSRNEPEQVKMYCDMAGFPLGVLRQSLRTRADGK